MIWPVSILSTKATGYKTTWILFFRVHTEGQRLLILFKPSHPIIGDIDSRMWFAMRLRFHYDTVFDRILHIRLPPSFTNFPPMTSNAVIVPNFGS